MTDPQFDALLEYWFAAEPATASAADPDTEPDAAGIGNLMRRWFAGAPAEDAEVNRRFGPLARAAADGAFDTRAGTASGRLALILLLDQLPRSLYRGTGEAFAQDAKALPLCVSGLPLGHLDELPALRRIFYCMPLQHAESREMQALSVATFEALTAIAAPAPVAKAIESSAGFARVHRDIIERFGRFPHRNAALGRESTAEEIGFLESGGPSFGQ